VGTEEVGDGVVITLKSHGKRGLTAVVRQARIGAVAEQQRREGEIALLGRGVQRGEAAVLPGINRGSVFQK
jgi:hypothetical protein